MTVHRTGARDYGRQIERIVWIQIKMAYQLEYQ